MRSCPRKFAFQYVQQLNPDFVPSSLLLGGAVHAALELYFRARLEGLAVTREAMLSAYHDAWNRNSRQNGDVPVRFNKNEDRAKLNALADRIIGSFLRSPLAKPRGVILGVEEELRATLDPDLPDVLAKVDLVTQTDGAVHVVDWKTSRSRWTPQKALESGDQLVLYGVTVGRLSHAPGLPVKLPFAIVTKAKTPVVQTVPNQESRGFRHQTSLRSAKLLARHIGGVSSGKSRYHFRQPGRNEPGTSRRFVFTSIEVSHVQ